MIPPSEKFSGLIYGPVPGEDGEQNYHEVVMICWIPLNIFSIVQLISYYAMDGTFRCCRPYTAFCVQGVLANTGIPMAFCAAPSERDYAFHFVRYCTCRALHSLHGRGATPIREKYESMPMLSDRGTALQKFAQTAAKTEGSPGIPHYWCYRHLIEWYGAGSSRLSSFCSVLYARSREEAEESWRRARENAERLLQGRFRSREAECLRDSMRKIDTLMENYDMWASSIKEERGHSYISDTTNHTEGFHPYLNESTRGLGCPASRYKTCVEYAMGRQKRCSESAQ